MRKIVIASDSFKGSLSSLEVAHAAEDHPGSHLPDGIYGHGNRNVQGSDTTMEPFCGFLLPYLGCILRFSEVKTSKN